MKKPLKMSINVRGTFESLKVGEYTVFSFREITESNIHAVRSRCKPKRFSMATDREKLTFTVTRVE